MQKKRLENPDKQDFILNGLIDFFKEHRLKEVNMDQMASHLNRSKATIYKHFRGKEEIIDAIIEKRILAISGFVVILHNESIPFRERLGESYNLLAMHIADLTNDFLADVKEMYPNIYERINTLIDLAVQQLKEYYVRGMDDGIFNKLNAELLAHNDFLFFRSLTDPAFLTDKSMTMEEAFGAFYEIRCKGLLK